RVHPAPEPRVVRPATRARDLGLHRRWPYRAPGVRALSWRACNPLAPGNAADRALLAGGFRRLGRSLRAGRVVVADASGERTLDEWCRPYDAYYVVGGGNLTDAFEELVWLRCCLIHA